MKDIIDSFIDNKEVAIAGVSSDRRKWGNLLFRELVKKGYTVYPVNPKLDEAEGTRCYRSVADLPAHIENLIIATSPASIPDIVGDCIKSGIKRIWLPQTGRSAASQMSEVVNKAVENNLGVVQNLCPLMFLSQSGIHRFHFWLKRITGTLPAELHLAN